MKKNISLIFLLLISFLAFSQSNLQWQGYFSYNNITDVSQGNESIFASSENAIFIKQLTTQELSTINAIDGLKTETISSIYRSNSKNLTLVGNNNGLLLIVQQDGTILQKRGIIDELPVTPTIKKINHFFEYQDKIFLSCDFGISVFNLSTLEFDETYYISPSGTYSIVKQVFTDDNFIYAATNNGIRRAVTTNPFLDDFNAWQDVSSGFSWNGIVSINNIIYATRNDNKLMRFDGPNNLVQVAQYGSEIIDLRVSENFLLVTTASNVYVYNENNIQQANFSINQLQNFNGNFTCATVKDNTLFIGTTTEGLVEVLLSNLSSPSFVKPNGPYLNSIFRLKKSSTKLWAVYGGYTRVYNPYGYICCEPRLFPVSYFEPENGWELIPTTDIFNARALSSIAFNPNNEEEIYISSFYSGLLKIEDTVPTQLYNVSNTGNDGLQTIPGQVPNDVRINGPAFDRNGNIWMTNSLVSKGLKVFKTNGSWQSFDLSSTIPDADDESFGIPIVDRNNTKWLPTLNNGLVAFNEVENKSMAIKTGTEGNLPNSDVRCVVLDNRNQLWIGTAKGLRIIQNISQFLSQDLIQTKEIIILEDGLAQELFFNQFIVDIAVDGANRKWVSIANAGVYLVSSNGQETIFHFTSENSPLPSNNVNDIEIDQVSGEVFFATDKGLVSYKGTATSPQDDLANVYIYPNPVRPEFNGTVKISGLTNRAVVKVTDISGNLVYETTSSGGTIEWDTTAFGKYKVASGVYMVFISAEDGIETNVKKVMIIR